ncbi:minor capsid protein [Clostridium taeniosporum]|uniref:Phage head morphogenesis domain-containing protein n=1 Tax=Clostridium taeniosporum TaxID=394958 RepID=A0A2I6SDI4_9CLOT|nr:minor capsid protein [Clostridium taeniosporum]AUO15633.1 hypothetical protein BGI42_15995 [Clostridium taeniosporum]
MKNSEYWEKRIANNTWTTYNNLEEKNRALLEMYQEASLSISDELYRVAEKMKTSTLMLSDMHKFNRLSGLQKNMENIIRDLGEKVEAFGRNNMMEGFKDIYSNIMIELGNIEFDMVPKKVMEEMLNRPWRGSDFSTRLWKNTQVLASNLNDIINNGLTQGKTVTEMAIQLNNRMNEGFNVSHRLVRTEIMHYLNESAFKGYVDAGCKKVQYWAAEDERVCERCGPKHGKPYDIDKRPILPLHANCRCTYLPIVELDDKKEEYKENDLYKKYGEQHYNLMRDIVDNSPDNVKKVWNTFENKLKIRSSTHNGGANYNRFYDGVQINIKKDSQGSSFEVPYGVSFHEFGHNIDYEANMIIGDSQKFRTISETFKDGLLGKTLKEEAKKRVDIIFKEIKATWDDDLRKPIKARAYDALSKEIRELEAKDRADISDMFEGATGAKVRGGFGHGKSYWKERDNGKEAFAEMFQATMCNPGSLESIKKYFPKSYKVFEEILDEINKGGI